MIERTEPSLSAISKANGTHQDSPPLRESSQGSPRLAALHDLQIPSPPGPDLDNQLAAALEEVRRLIDR